MEFQMTSLGSRVNVFQLNDLKSQGGYLLAHVTFCCFRLPLCRSKSQASCFNTHLLTCIRLDRKRSRSHRTAYIWSTKSIVVKHVRVIAGTLTVRYGQVFFPYTFLNRRKLICVYTRNIALAFKCVCTSAGFNLKRDPWALFSVNLIKLNHALSRI